MIPEAASGAVNRGCACHLDDGEVLGLVVKLLGLIVDTNKGGMGSLKGLISCLLLDSGS